VLKVQHKPIKRSKLGFKTKEQKKPKRIQVWRTGLSGVPPDSVRCTRGDRLKLFTFGFLEEPLRYNSPDCPVGHRTVRCASGATIIKRNGHLQRSPANVNITRTVRVESEQRQKAHRTVNSDCPVRHQTVRCPSCQSSNGRNR
jgi:hypothetical protein